MKLSVQASQHINVAKQLIDCFARNYPNAGYCETLVSNTTKSKRLAGDSDVAERRAVVFSAITHFDHSIRLLLQVFGEDIANRIEPLNLFFRSNTHYQPSLSKCLNHVSALLESNKAEHSFLISFLSIRRDPLSAISILESLLESTQYSLTEWKAYQVRRSKLLALPRITEYPNGDGSSSTKEKSNLILSHIEEVKQGCEERSASSKHWTQCDIALLFKICMNLNQLLADYNSEYGEY